MLVCPKCLRFFQGKTDIDFSLISSSLHAKISRVFAKRVQIGDITSKLVGEERIEEGKINGKKSEKKTLMKKTGQIESTHKK